VVHYSHFQCSMHVHSYSLCCNCSPISSERNHSVARRRTCVETFGLQQCCACWSAELSASPSSVHSSRSPAYILLRSFHRHSRQFSLVAITERIQFKLANIVYRSLQGTALSEVAYTIWLTFHWFSTTCDNQPGECRR
jgi:hypothetical protein